MTPLDDLPAAQRAVLELVLKRGRTYDEIAALLAIDRAGVRERALSGFDALGPSTSVPPERRALITDYLLGQLPERLSEQVARRLAGEASERAWARVIASELAPIAATPLPRIPTGAELPDAGAGDGARTSSPAPAIVTAAAEAADRGLDDDPAAEREPHHEPARPRGTATTPRSARGAESSPRSSRVGGAILLGVGALVVVVVIVVLLLNSGSSKTPTSSTVASSSTTTATTPAASTTPSATSTGSGTTATTGTTPKALATVKLTAAKPGSKAQGVAEAFDQSGTPYLAIVAINLTANSHNYYAVWLTNSATDSRLLGFAPAVTTSGRLQAATTLKSTDGHYTQLVITTETQPHPKVPGPPVLSGAFSLKSP